ncbi:hypothetical protein AMECASPLE_010690 [Ameca splendens]|uniref:C2H2-type domain-containing protein n=1 Tax=Ameca splendens TaxID=208324 RepID=A0ABV0XPH9_9TELE
MKNRLCGLCFRSYNNLYQHFKFSHTIVNPQERSLLLKYGSAKFRGALTCPICHKTKLVRLDKHLMDHHCIREYEDRQPVLEDAKRAEIIKQLAVLRGSEPDKPMVSTLDIVSTAQPDPETVHLHEDLEDYNVIKVEVNELPIDSSQMISLMPDEERDPMDCTQNLHPAELVDQPDQYAKTLVSSADFDTKKSCSCKLNEVSEDLKYCKRQVEQLTNRVDKLDQYLMKTRKQQMFTKSANAQQSVTSVKRAKLEDKKTDDVPLYEVILKDFKGCHMAKRAGKTRLTNSQQAENHAKQFCSYMLNESPFSAGHKDLTFLYQMDKLYSFSRSLAVQGYAPSTFQKRLCNVIMFLKHIESNFQKPSKLTHEQLSEISDEIRRLKAQLVSKEAVYQQESWHRMTENFTAVETEFLIVAQQKIPVLLKHIHNSPNVMADHNKLMGYMMGYFAIQTRNSLVKLANMIKDNVTSAESSMDKRLFWVEVNENKSIHSSGQPVLFLSLKEYLWLDLLINTSCCHQASQCQYVFHTVFGNKISIPGTLLRAACIDSGIETSKFMSSEQRQQLERFISCYSQLKVLNSPTQCPTEGNHTDVVEDLSLKDGELRNRNDRHQEEEDTKMDYVPELGRLSSQFTVPEDTTKTRVHKEKQKTTFCHETPSKYVVQLKGFDQSSVEGCQRGISFLKEPHQPCGQQAVHSSEDIQIQGLAGQQIPGGTADFSSQYPPKHPFLPCDLKVKQEPSD